jgi:hypothetical protein
MNCDSVRELVLRKPRDHALVELHQSLDVIEQPVEPRRRNAIFVRQSRWHLLKPADTITQNEFPGASRRLGARTPITPVPTHTESGT